MTKITTDFTGLENATTLVLDGRAIEAMRTSIAHLGVPGRAAG